MVSLNKDNFHKCRLCPYGTKSLRIIIDHVKRHGPKLGKLGPFCNIPVLEPLKCDFCDFEYDLKVVVERHTALVHGKNQISEPEIFLRAYTCNKCSFETLSLLVYLRHACSEQDLNSEETVEGVSNIDQDQESQSENSRLSAAQDIPRSCHETCSKNSSSKVSRVRNGGETDIFFCEICSNKFKHASELNEHELSQHINEWFYCKYCSFKSLWKRGLTKHVKAKHARQINAKCELC